MRTISSDQPKVKEYARTPGSRNSMLKVRSWIRSGIAEELVETLLADAAAAVRVRVGAVIGSRLVAFDRDA
jgi:hypothetical protein